MQKLHRHPRDSAMPAARWTTNVNKATENFTINYFRRINTSQVFNCITETFQNLRVNTPLHCLVLENTEISLPDKILAARVNPKNWLFPTPQRFRKSKSLSEKHLSGSYKTKHKWVMLQHWNWAREDVCEACSSWFQNAKSTWDKIPAEMQMWSCFACQNMSSLQKPRENQPVLKAAISAFHHSLVWVRPRCSAWLTTNIN